MVTRHFDDRFLTILMQDDVGGLEVKHNGHWKPIKPIDQTFVVNFGNLFEHLTYGTVKCKFMTNFYF